MMSKNDLQVLNGLISSIEKALDEENEETMYDSLYMADALYGDLIPKIGTYVGLVELHSGLIKRHSEIILQLLKQLYDHESITFRTGIMPLTHDNLSVCPKAQEVYKSGINKYTSQCYERNVLDDMRLALELLVKQFLGNDKSLENQISELGKKLQSEEISKELRNLINKIVEYMCKYQNNYIKHSDSVNMSELDFVIEQTSAVINLIVHLM